MSINQFQDANQFPHDNQINPLQTINLMHIERETERVCGWRACESAMDRESE
jgi:hypothetical protein